MLKFIFNMVCKKQQKVSAFERTFIFYNKYLGIRHF